MNTEYKRLNLLMRIVIFIAVVLFLVFVVQVANAQEIPMPDVASTTHKVFATNADNVYGTLVGVLFFIIIALLWVLYVFLTKLVPLLEGFKTVIANNTQVNHAIIEELKDLQKHIDTKHEVLAIKIETQIDKMGSKIISELKTPIMPHGS